MNNKMFKRIVATAVSVVMLGTCAFATNITVGTYKDDTLSFTYTYDEENVSKVTYLAYAAKVAADQTATGANIAEIAGTKYDLCEIIAIDQLEGEAITGSKEVAINSALMNVGTDAAPVTAPYIILKSGDDAEGTTASQILITTGAEEPPVGGPVVTFMNGTTKVAELTASNGAITAPAAVTKDAIGTVNFTFYKWTTEDGKTDYDAGSSIPVAEAITLYAKYDTGLKLGDVDGNGTIGTLDYGQVKNKYRNKTIRYAVGEPIYEGSDILLGDVDGNGSIGTLDYGQVKNKYRNKTIRYAVGEPIYIINKD